ncbi:hypothetical protein [Ruminococcus albus]|nr:hypothetical protein [Ruminococcus albus]
MPGNEYIFGISSSVLSDFYDMLMKMEAGQERVAEHDDNMNR